MYLCQEDASTANGLDMFLTLVGENLKVKRKYAVTVAKKNMANVAMIHFALTVRKVILLLLSYAVDID